MRLVETGRQQLDSVRMILRLAEVLRIDDYSELIEIARPPRRRSTDDAHALMGAIEPTLINHPDTAIGRGPALMYGSVGDLAAEVARCQSVWENSPVRFSTLAQRLPAVVVRLRADAPDRTVPELRIRAYHISCQLLRRIGAYNLAWVVADRAAEDSLRGGCSILTAASAWHIAATLLDLGRFGACHDYASAAAAVLSQDLPEPRDSAVLWGALHLLAAQSATLDKDETAAQQSISRARTAARALGNGGSCHGIRFDTNEINSAMMEVALQGKDFGEIVRMAGQVEFPEHYPVAATARYHIVLAYGFAHIGEHLAATLALDKAATACPEELRFDYDAQRTLHHLIKHGGRKPRREVTRLAGLAHVR
ncbi:hypothetical protein GCM10027088_45770 [Nocardia goodfellowii]